MIGKPGRSTGSYFTLKEIRRQSQTRGSGRLTHIGMCFKRVTGLLIHCRLQGYNNRSSGAGHMVRKEHVHLVISILTHARMHAHKYTPKEQ